jgi:hypothetical protein
MLAYVIPFPVGFFSRSYPLAILFGLLSAYAVIVVPVVASIYFGNPEPGYPAATFVAIIQCTIPAVVVSALGHYSRRKRLARTQPTQRT